MIFCFLILVNFGAQDSALLYTISPLLRWSKGLHPILCLCSSIPHSNANASTSTPLQHPALSKRIVLHSLSRLRLSVTVLEQKKAPRKKISTPQMYKPLIQCVAVTTEKSHHKTRKKTNIKCVYHSSTSCTTCA